MNTLFAVWFFLPAGLANVSPIFFSRMPGLKHWNTPLDFGKSYKGRVIFGRNKTWRGLIGGGLVGLLTLLLQSYLYLRFEWARELSGPLDYGDAALLWLGPLLGLGALAGDAVESFFKRRANVPPGEAWFPFDQTDYIVGGLLLSLPVVRLSLPEYGLIFIVWFLAHLIFSYIGFRLGLKPKPI